MKLLTFLVLAAAAVAFAAWVYGRRELPVPGRWVLAAVRAAALVLALLLLLDPRVPAAESGEARWVLVDNSISMTVGPAGTVPWDSARALAEDLRVEGARVLRFGHTPIESLGDSALAAVPAHARSLLLPALERAAEAGAREIVVLSDLRLEDPVAVRAALERLGTSVRFVPLGGAVRNAGVTLALPAAPRRERTVEGLVTVFASGTSPADSVELEVREEGRLVWSGRAPAPAAGRVVQLPVTLPPPAAPGGGEVRYEARVSLEGDAFGGDDRTVAYSLVPAEQGALVVVSFSPDWELRHLLPVLARATGLPALGYMQVGDRFLPTSSGGEGLPLSGEEVTRRATEARVLVLQGLGTQAPGWALRLAADAPRVLVFATDPEGARAAGIVAGAAQDGEWYVGGAPPASVLAAELSGLPYPELPPLRELLPAGGGNGSIAPLDARLRGVGTPEPALLLRQRGNGRVAAAMARDWWRWALRPGPAEEAYRRVWSGVAGWLLAADEGAARSVRPVARVIAPGAPVEWTGGGVAPLAITVSEGDHVVVDTSLAEPVPGIRTPPLPEGTYAYVARAGPDSASGRFDVLGASAELRLEQAALPDSVRPAAGARGESPGRPLRAHALPWLLLIGLLCGEWIARRRRGLR